MKWQSEMKFPMAFGWAILAFLAAFVVLASSGVQDASGLTLRNPCETGPPISCSETSVTEDGVSLILSNYDSRIMEIKKIEIVSDVTGDCFWEAPFPFDYSNSTVAYPELESRNAPIAFILTSNSRANDGNGTFIPKSAKGANGTRVNPDNNANWGAPDNSSLAGCAFNPDNSREKNQYEEAYFTIIYSWKGSQLDHTVSGSFFTEDPPTEALITSCSGSQCPWSTPTILNGSTLPFFLFLILFLLLVFLAVWNRAKPKRKR